MRQVAGQLRMHGAPKLCRARPVLRRHGAEGVRTGAERGDVAQPLRKLQPPIPVQETSVAKAVLTISSKNYGAWALRGWLLTKLSGLEFTEKVIPPDDPAMKAEILLLSASMLVPSLQHNGIKVWDTLAIAEYLNEIKPKAQLLPADAKARAHCRAICGEMHSGFSSLRSALPMNIKAHFPNFKIWSRALSDIERVREIWDECLSTYGGPYLFGKQPTVADAMYAPVVTRFLTYDVALSKAEAAYCKRIMELPAMQEWVEAARKEPDEIDELDAEF
jgi:glutathione S-transferase